MNIFKIIIICLISTIIIELLFALLLGIRKRIDIVNAILVNILTNPFVSSLPLFINVRYGVRARNITLAILEVVTVLIEGYIYKKYLNYKKINPYFLSLILNCASYFIGLIIL